MKSIRGVAIALLSLALIVVTASLVIVTSGKTGEDNKNSTKIPVTFGQITQKFESAERYNEMLTLLGSLSVVVLLILAIIAKHYLDMQHRMEYKIIYQNLQNGLVEIRRNM